MSLFGKFTNAKILFILLLLCCFVPPLKAEALYQDFDGVYHIASAKDLQEFSALVSGNVNGYSKQAVLDTDIDLSELEHGWVSIYSDLTGGFQGVFDGRGHRIKGLKSGPGDARYIGTLNVDLYGLFGAVARGATVKNLIIENPVISSAGMTGTRYVGIIAALNQGNIENCHVIGGSIDMGAGFAGGHRWEKRQGGTARFTLNKRL